MENIGTDKITELIEFFKFGYQGDTQDLLYLGICLYCCYKMFKLILKFIKKGSGV